MKPLEGGNKLEMGETWRVYHRREGKNRLADRCAGVTYNIDTFIILV
jgi:hypothetical protein